MSAVVERLREEIKTYIEKADEKVVKMVHAMLEADAEDTDWWNTVPDDVKERLEKSFQQGESGNVIPHEEVVKSYPRWFTK